MTAKPELCRKIQLDVLEALKAELNVSKSSLESEVSYSARQITFDVVT